MRRTHACRIRTRLWLRFTTVFGLALFTALTTATARASSGPIPPEPAAGSIPPAYRALYMTLGLGGTAIGYAGRIQITGAYRRWFAAGLLGSTTEFQIFGPTPTQSLWEVGALTGYHRDFGNVIFATGIGIAWTSSVTRGALLESASYSGHLSDRYAEVRNRGIGVPFAIQAIYHGGTLGVGAQLFGNYNADLPIFGIAGTLHVGGF